MMLYSAMSRWHIVFKLSNLFSWSSKVKGPDPNCIAKDQSLTSFTINCLISFLLMKNTCLANVIVRILLISLVN
jgi:hypothetical protein